MNFEQPKEEGGYLPPKYENMPSELVEELWVLPTFVDKEKNERERKKKKNCYR